MAELVTLAAAAVVVGKGESTIRRWVQRGKLATVTREHDGWTLVDLEAVRALVASVPGAPVKAPAAHAPERLEDVELRIEVATLRAQVEGLRERLADRDRELQLLRVDLDRANAERLGLLSRHVQTATALAALTGELDRYSRLGAWGRLLQAPPSPKQIGTVVDGRTDGEHD